MKETKIYCDICTNEIKDYPYKTTLQFDRFGFKSDIDMNYEEVCDTCAKKIFIFVEEMKKNDKREI